VIASPFACPPTLSRRSALRRATRSSCGSPACGPVEIARAIAAERREPLSRVSRSRAGSYGLAIIDALMLSSALQAASDTLWSEDMQHGMLIDGMLRIANPFCATS